MSVPSQTSARLLETSFLASLASLNICPNLFTQQNDLPPDPDKPHIPAVVLAANVSGTFWEMKYKGRYADISVLRAVCRVDGSNPASGRELEALASRVKAAVEGAKPAGWIYLWLNHSGFDDGFSGSTRIKTILWDVHCLPGTVPV